MKNLQDAKRHSIQVQLESCRDLDAAIIERVRELKAERKFTATFRDMASLYFSLQEGDISVLANLFPFALGSPAPGGAKDGSSIDATSEPQPLRVSGNLKSLTSSSKLVPGPEDHDDLPDLLEVKNVSSEAGGVAAQNLVKSMLAMQSVKSEKPAKAGKSVKKKQQSLEDMLEIRTVGSA